MKTPLSVMVDMDFNGQGVGNVTLNNLPLIPEEYVLAPAVQFNEKGEAEILSYALIHISLMPNHQQWISKLVEAKQSALAE